jgi:predicted ribosome quality control (RQC) complex YloA/Tae2 family protein
MKTEIFQHKMVEYTIYIGQNKQDNFDIIDAASSSDVWFHVSDFPSCHVILKNDEKISSIPHQVIKRCAYLCKIHSKAKTQSKCYISYTTIDNIKKTEIVGKVQVKNYKTVSV